MTQTDEEDIFRQARIKVMHISYSFVSGFESIKLSHVT
jgi:hypothetical protein